MDVRMTVKRQIPGKGEVGENGEEEIRERGA